ncbi:hypothetical protein GCM10028856_05950 [Halopiger thermotolerans]
MQIGPAAEPDQVTEIEDRNPADEPDGAADVTRVDHSNVPTCGQRANKSGDDAVSRRIGDVYPRFQLDFR